MVSEDDHWRRIFVVGGVRSGKSRFAQEQALQIAGGRPVRFVATAQVMPGDESMEERVSRHVAARPADWTTVEEPRDLASAVQLPGTESVVLIDCLTLWLANLFADQGDPEAADFGQRIESAVESAMDEFLVTLPKVQRHVITIANEVGSGVVPPTRIGNIFADMQGMVNQRAAAASSEVYHMVAGIPIQIK